MNTAVETTNLNIVNGINVTALKQAITDIGANPDGFLYPLGPSLI